MNPALQSRLDATVLLVEGASKCPGLASLLGQRGLRPILDVRSEGLLHRLTAEPVGAVVLPASKDLVADLTRQLRVLEADRRVVLVWIGESPSGETAARFLRAGAGGYLPADADASLVSDVVWKGLDSRLRLLAEDRQTSGLRQALAELTGQVDHEMAVVQERLIGSLESLVRIGEAAHPHFLGHALRVADLASTIASALGETDETLNRIRLAGRLHDIGMIGVPGRLLEKPGALTDQEFESIKQHPVLASEILAVYPDFEDITGAIRGHHEHWDGSGYPDQLAGEEIPRMARILAVAEVFDALTSARPYQPAEGVAHALARIQGLAGTVLDPEICALLPRVFGLRHSLTFVHDIVPPRFEGERSGVFQAGNAA